MQIKTVSIEKPEVINFILGQSHFIKTVEDLYEAMMNSVPGIKFGIAFCEASGKRLIRWTGNDDCLIELQSAKNLPEVCRIFCATANPTEVLGAETDLERGVMGVIAGEPPLGLEAGEDIEWRKSFLRMIGYKEK